MSQDKPRAVVKVIELVGSSPESFSDAVRNAVSIASESIRNITGVEVLSSTADVEGGNLSVYKVNCKIAFIVESSSAGQAGESSGTTAGVPGPSAHGPSGGPLPVA